MPARQSVTEGLQGRFRDVLRDRRGQVIWDGGWRANTIVGDCRRLLAGFMRGAPTASLGIQGLQVGRGDPAWDVLFQPAPATQAALVDAHPFTVPRAALTFSYLTGGVVSPTPTNELQVFASLGPGSPP